MQSMPTKQPQETVTFKTAKGTEFPLLLLKGKKYLQVAHRVAWFREEHSDWTITTEFVEVNVEKKYAIARATISNNEGVRIATATKAESVAGFADYIEKAETGAVGRALALCGYGTQFATELDEGERLVDAPATRDKIKQAEKEYEQQVGDGDFTPKVLEKL